MSDDYLTYDGPSSDVQTSDLVPFYATLAGTVAADIQFEGTLSCTCPDNYTMLSQVASLCNKTASAITVTIQITNGTITIPLVEVVLAANSAAGGNELVSPSDNFRLVAPPGFKFQVVSSAATSADVQMLVRLIFGAGL